MRALSSLLLALPLSAGVSAARHQRRDAPSQAPNVTVSVAPKRFVVEVDQNADLDVVAAQFPNAKVLKKWSSPIFKGFSLESGDVNVDSLQATERVVQAWPVNRMKLPNVTVSHTFSSIVDAGALNYSVHAATGVQELHDAGIFGKGIQVAIVDTGTDYTHPALGGGFGPGYKVAGGYDFVGDGYYPWADDLLPDSDPMDDIGHGTHVAGILAGESDQFVGVAPEVTIYSYKVFTHVDEVSDDTVLDAFLAAYNDGADIITASLGGLSGWSEGSWAELASRLVDQGVVITIAAGNSGNDGVFYGSNGAWGKGVVAVASMDPTVTPATPFTAVFSEADGASNTTRLAYFPANTLLWDLEAPGLPVFPLSGDVTLNDEACSPLPADTTPDLSNKIVLIRQGNCDFVTQQANLEPFGAAYILIYSNNSAIFTPPTYDANSSLALITNDAAFAIIDTVKAGGNVTAWMPAADQDQYVGAYNAAGGIPSGFTSWGGSYELEIKPDVAAPGNNILSTYPGDSYAIMSGTSMATPYMAGVAALYLSSIGGGRKVHGPGIAKIVANRLVSSGAALPWQAWSPAYDELPTNYGYWAPPVQVGSGLIQAQKVVKSTTQLSFDAGAFALNDTAHFSRYHTVDITNNAKVPVSYTFSLQPAGGFNAQSPSEPDLLIWQPEIAPITAVPSVSFPSGKFTVQPGQTKTAQFNFNPPTGLDEDLLPVYSGKVLISGSNGDELSIPYMGAAFDLKTSMRGKMFASNTPYQVGGDDGLNIDQYHAYDFNLSYFQANYPQIYIDLKWGASQIRWDVYEAGFKESQWNYPPVEGKDGFIGSVAYHADSGTRWRFDPNYEDKENTINFPVYQQPRTGIWDRNEAVFWWFGKLANGSYIVPGNYSWRIAVLTPFSDPTHNDNWEVWKTPDITVLPYVTDYGTE